MKIIYPTKPVADYYLEGFSYKQVSGQGYVQWQNLQSGWNNLITFDFSDVKGFLKILNLQTHHSGNATGQTLGVRFRLKAGVNYYTIYEGFWIYEQMPQRWTVSVTPDLPLAPGDSGYLDVWYATGTVTYSIYVDLLFAQYA